MKRIILMFILTWFVHVQFKAQEVKPKCTLATIYSAQGKKGETDKELIELLTSVKEKLFNEFASLIPYKLVPEEDLLNNEKYNVSKLEELKLIKKAKCVTPEGYFALRGYDTKKHGGKIQMNFVKRIYDIIETEYVMYFSIVYMGTGGNTVDVPGLKTVKYEGLDGSTKSASTWGTNKVKIPSGTNAIVNLRVYDSKGKIVYQVKVKSGKSLDVAMEKFVEALKKKVK